MGSVVVLVGSMPSLASLVSLGSLSGSTATSSCVESSSYSVVYFILQRLRLLFIFNKMLENFPHKYYK
ncbi:hypothetical protein OIU74_000662, partial [Salix koriyanagi]